MLEVRNLSKMYGDFLAVDDVSFSVGRGEIVGVVGPNGAGKTSIIKMIVGLVEPSRGEISVAGYCMRNAPEEAKRLIGYLPEESPVYEEMTALEYLDFFADVYGVEREEARRRAERVLDELCLSHRERRLGEMSKGMRRKVMIARSLINDPELLVYDEPASGLDPITSAQLMEYIRRLRGRKTILMTTHNLYQAERLCDRVVILKGGRVVAQGGVREIKRRFGGVRYTLRFRSPGSRGSGSRVVTCTSLEELNAIAGEVVHSGGEILDIENHTSSLEEIFLTVVSGS
ncbi:MAG: ABC transporter ATP-binding protein [Euryarchaeota archaeon]|nr:ABC transporter ATP-binding protein [Euryarchaeota archaeon]